MQTVKSIYMQIGFWLNGLGSSWVESLGKIRLVINYPSKS